jgi:hypothetical protein
MSRSETMRRLLGEANRYPRSREPHGNHGKVSMPAGVRRIHAIDRRREPKVGNNNKDSALKPIPSTGGTGCPRAIRLGDLGVTNLEISKIATAAARSTRPRSDGDQRVAPVSLLGLPGGFFGSRPAWTRGRTHRLVGKLGRIRKCPQPKLCGQHIQPERDSKCRTKAGREVQPDYREKREPDPNGAIPMPMANARIIQRR